MVWVEWGTGMSFQLRVAGPPAPLTLSDSFEAEMRIESISQDRSFVPSHGSRTGAYPVCVGIARNSTLKIPDICVSNVTACSGSRFSIDCRTSAARGDATFGLAFA